MDMKEDLNKIVYKYILNSGHCKCAAIFLKRSKLTNDDDDTPLSKEVLSSIADLTQIYEAYRSFSKPTFIESTKTNNSKRNNLPTTAATVAAGVKSTEEPIVTKKAAAKDSSSSSEDSSSSSSDDSSSDEEIAHTKTPVKSTSVTKPTPQSSAGKTPLVVVVAKASIAKISSSSSETESSDSDGSNDEQVVTKPTLKSTPVIKKNVEVKVVEKTKSSKTDLKPSSATVSSSSKKPIPTKSSSSSDSDDDSSDDSSVEKTVATKPDKKSKATVELSTAKAKIVSNLAPGPSIAVKASAKPPSSVEKKAVIGKKSTAVQSNSSSDDSDDSSSDSDDSCSSSDESVPTKTPIAPTLKSTPAKKLTAVESSEEDSESDSSSDESADVTAVVNDKKRKLNNVVAVAAAQRSTKEDNAKTKIQKVDSSSSESDSESSSDSDDSSDDSSEESESEEAIQERVQMKNELNKKKMEDSKRASEEWMKVTHHIYPYNVSVTHSSSSS
jgi:nucleolin